MTVNALATRQVKNVHGRAVAIVAKIILFQMHAPSVSAVPPYLEIECPVETLICTLDAAGTQHQMDVILAISSAWRKTGVEKVSGMLLAHVVLEVNRLVAVTLTAPIATDGCTHKKGHQQDDYLQDTDHFHTLLTLTHLGILGCINNVAYLLRYFAI